MQQIEDRLEKRGLGQYARRMSKIDQSISIRDTDDLPELLSPIADITKNSFPNAKFSRSLFSTRVQNTGVRSCWASYGYSDPARCEELRPDSGHLSA